MRKSKFDKRVEKAIIKSLDAAARKHGMDEIKHAAAKWLNVQRARSSVEKKRRALERELAEVNAKLK